MQRAASQHPSEPRLAEHSARPRSQARARAYPRLLEAGLLATATAVASCGGHVDSVSLTGGAPLPFGSGGASPALGGAAGAGGSTTTGGTATTGGMDPTGGAASAGGTVATGGMVATAATGAVGGLPAPYAGVVEVFIQQTTDCVDAGEPIHLELVGAEDGTVKITGMRARTGPDEMSECPYFSQEGSCIIPEPIEAIFEGSNGSHVQDLFDDLPRTTCLNSENVRCEMPCNAVTINVDGTDYGSTFCCGGFEDPAYAEQATAAVDELMRMIE